MGEYFILCYFRCKVIILFNVRCWLKILRKTEGRPKVLDSHYFHPNLTIRVAHNKYFNADFSPMLIELCSAPICTFCIKMNFMVSYIAIL